MSQWAKYFTPEEYAEMREVRTPEELEDELARMRAKSEHYRVAEELGFDAEEAMFIRLYGMIAMHEERTS